jgi:electron transfer flavoprotein alpha subunit
MIDALVVAEHAAGVLNSSTAKCVSCARELAPRNLAVAVLCEPGSDVPQRAARLAGVTAVLAIRHPANRAPLAAVLAPQVADVAARFTHVLAPSTTFGKDLLPRVAALLGVGQISDVMRVETPYRFARPIYAGNAIVTVEAPARSPIVATVRMASYAACAAADAAAPIEELEPSSELPTHTRFVELQSAGSARPDLQSATRVVAGGRALGSADNFKLIYELADRLGAAVGASRAAVDASFVANDLQVGQTGKIIAPELYFAVGISGAIQHLTGIKDAGTIVAINKDPNAPIFEIADFGLVADLFGAVPELLAALDEARR